MLSTEQIQTHQIQQTQVDSNGNNGLMVLLNNNLYTDATTLMLTYGATDINNLIGMLQHFNKNNEDALFIACKNDMTSTANDIIECFDIADSLPSALININNETALLWACYNKMSEVADNIVERMRDTENMGLCYLGHANNDGNTALILACHNSMISTAIKLLRSKLAKPEYINNNNGTALLWACCKGLDEVVKEILKYPNCQIKHMRGFVSPLNIAHKNCFDDIVIKLLRYDWTILEIEKDFTILEILNENHLYLKLKGKITGKLVGILANTQFEYLLNFTELVKFKLENEQLKMDDICVSKNAECLICSIPSDQTYCFGECGHVICGHENCIGQLNSCPICRSNSSGFRCFLA